MNLKISGPFHSMEMTVKHSLTRHMICLVSGSGKSVSDSIILFHQSRPGYWNSLTVIQLCGRNKGTEPNEKQVKTNVSTYFKTSLEQDLGNQEKERLVPSMFEKPVDLVDKIENTIRDSHEPSDHIETSTKTSQFQVCLHSLRYIVIMNHCNLLRHNFFCSGYSNLGRFGRRCNHKGKRRNNSISSSNYSNQSASSARNDETTLCYLQQTMGTKGSTSC